MPYKPRDEKTVGLFFENNSLKAAFASVEKGVLKIGKLVDLPLQVDREGGDVKPLYIDEEKKEIQGFAESHLSITGLSGSDVLVRRIRLKLTKERDIDEAFAFQAEPLLPYPMDMALLDKLTAEKQEGATLITFLATKKEYLQKHLLFWQERGMDPEVVSAESIALNAFANHFCETREPLFVVYIGRNSSLLILLKKGKLLASHAISEGWETLYNGLLQDRALKPPPPQELFSIDFTRLESLPHLNEAAQKLFKAIQWNLIAETKETKLKETPTLLFTGEGGNLAHFSATAAQFLNLHLETVDPKESSCTAAELNTFAIPIGLALSSQPSFETPINFRQGELIYPTPWKRFQKSLYLYAALSLLLALSLYFFGTSYYQYREDDLKRKYLSLLSLAQKPYEGFEKQYEVKYPAGREGIIPIEELTATELGRRLDFLEKEIRSMPDTFALLPNIPRVADVIAWINTHPALKCGEEAPLPCYPFSIDLFNYTLVKRPEQNKKTEKYQVKIDLEFTTTSPRIAREFHDALISPNEFVDPKAEIKWNATKGKYRTSFYLKDKTLYPSPLQVRDVR